MRVLATIIAVFLSLQVADVLAHGQSFARLTGNPTDGFEWELRAADLNKVIALDTNNNGSVSLQEIKENPVALQRIIDQSLQWYSLGVACINRWRYVNARKVGSGYNLRLGFDVVCSQKKLPDRMAYNFLFAIDPLHRAMVDFEFDGAAVKAAFSDNNRQIRLSTGEGQSLLARAIDFVVAGVHHIFIGADHLLFLVTLIFPLFYLAVKHYQSSGRSNILLRLIAQYTVVFTLAHSMSLIVASLGWLSFSARWVEALIAATVILGGWNLLRRQKTTIPLMMVFMIGLVHGLGFANVLADLSTDKLLLVEIVGFNLGVEIGQLLFVALIIPVLFMLNRTNYLTQSYRIVGLAVVGISSLWMLERVWEVTPF